MHQLQTRILQASFPFLRPGGRLVYSTCSIEPEENEEVVAFVRQNIKELEFVEERSTIPFRDNLDGAYAALFRKG